MSDQTTEGSSILGLDPAGLRSRYREIFGDESIFLREVVQNAIQAIRSDTTPGGRVDIRVQPENWLIEVCDDGIGMTLDQARLSVARFFGSGWGRPSPTLKNSADLRRELMEALAGAFGVPVPDMPLAPMSDTSASTLDQTEIGRFGMGLTTCLMVGDRYTVESAPRGGGSPSRHVVRVGLRDGLATVLHDWEVLAEGSRPPGTRVTIHVGMQDAPPLLAIRQRQFVSPQFIEGQLRRWFSLSEVPVHLDGRVIVGADPDPALIPDSFYHVTNSRRPRDILIGVELQRRGSSGYLRAYLGLPRDTDPGQVAVHCRGIFVGNLPSSEVFGDDLAFLSGNLDSDLFDLQIDRNRLQDNARLKQFRRMIGLAFCEELARVAEHAWADYVQAINTHRASILRFLYANDDASRSLGSLIPFRHALRASVWLPLRYFAESPLTTRDGRRFVAYSSPHTRGHPAIDVMARRRHACLDADLYIPSREGKANLDVLFIDDHFNVTQSPLRCERVDVLLAELDQGHLQSQGGHKIERLTNYARSELERWCDLRWTRLGTADYIGLVTTPSARAYKQELPGFVGHQGSGQLPLMLDRLLALMGKDTSAEMRRELGEAAPQPRPSIILNLDHPAVHLLEGSPDTSRSPRVATLLAATLLLSAGATDDTTLLDIVHRHLIEMLADAKDMSK